MEIITREEVKQLSLDSLIILHTMLDEEIERREKEEKEELWKRISDTISEYVKKYGSIEIYFTGEEILYLDSHAIFPTQGEIQLQ